MNNQIEAKQAIQYYFGDVVDLGKTKGQQKKDISLLETAPLLPLDPEAQKLRKSLNTRYAQDLRDGKDVNISLTGRSVRVAASLMPGDIVLLKTKIDPADRIGYYVLGTIGPRTNYQKGLVEISLGAKIEKDAQGRLSIYMPDRQNPANTSFSFEATSDNLAGSSELPETEGSQAILEANGQVTPNPRHTWGVLLEANPGSPVALEMDKMSGGSSEKKAGVVDVWEDTGNKERLLMNKASIGPKNPNAFIPISESNIVISEKDIPVQGQDIVWELVLRKQYLDEGALDNGVIQPLRRPSGAQDEKIGLVVANMDAQGLGKKIKQVKEERMGKL